MQEDEVRVAWEVPCSVLRYCASLDRSNPFTGTFLGKFKAF